MQKVFYYVLPGTSSDGVSPANIWNPIEIEVSQEIKTIEDIETVLLPLVKEKYLEISLAELYENKNSKELDEAMAELAKLGLTKEVLETEIRSKMKDVKIFSFSFLRTEGTTYITGDGARNISFS